ncbi:MAG: ROK family protein [Actinoallomurus sp.]
MIVALDVGGTSMKGAIMDHGLDRTATVRRPTPRGEAAVTAVLDTIADLVAQAGDAEAVGIAVPGIVDDENGVAVWSENIGWHDVPFRDLIERRTGLPVAVGHDVRAGGTAELRLGAAKGTRNSLVVPIGTGIAAAMVIDGHLCVGNGYAGEIGHMSVGADEPCVCGGTGCLEAVASGPAVARSYSRRTGRETTAVEVAELVAKGEPDALAVWAETVGWLGTALAAATVMAAPEVIVIGGGMSRAGDLLLTPLAEDIDARLTFHRRPRLTTARFADEAGCVGAGLWALDLLESQ